MSKQVKIGKYVIVNNQPILFPGAIQHKDVSTKAQSAGYFLVAVESSELDVVCCGESSTLNLRSDQSNDARIIGEFIKTIIKDLPNILSDRQGSNP